MPAPCQADPTGCAVCLAALAAALFALFGLAMVALDRRRERRALKARPAAPAPTPPAEAPTARYPPAPALPEVPGAAAWGGLYDDAETRPDPLAVPTLPTHLARPSSMRPPAPNWDPRRTLSSSPDEVASELEAAAKQLRQSSGRPIPVPPEFRKKEP